MQFGERDREHLLIDGQCQYIDLAKPKRRALVPDCSKPD